MIIWKRKIILRLRKGYRCIFTMYIPEYIICWLSIPHGQANVSGNAHLISTEWLGNITLIYGIVFTVGWGTKCQCFCSPYLKTWFFYVVFKAKLNGTIGILRFRHTIIELLWPSRSIMVWRKRKILMVPFNSALKTT